VSNFTRYTAFRFVGVKMTMYEILVGLVGVPGNDVAEIILYFGAVCLSVLMVYFVLYLFKFIASIVK
jgi:hypothetical protein